MSWIKAITTFLRNNFTAREHQQDPINGNVPVVKKTISKPASSIHDHIPAPPGMSNLPWIDISIIKPGSPDLVPFS
jgi:hypothetical protein